MNFSEQEIRRVVFKRVQSLISDNSISEESRELAIDELTELMIDLNIDEEEGK